METPHEIKRRGIMGALFFLGNSGYMAILGLIANLLFTIYLTPAQYGLYFIVLSITASFNYFTDLGLAAALVQKKEPKESEFYTAFTLQFILVSCVVTIAILLTPLLVNSQSIDIAGRNLYLAMIFSLFILSFKSIPSTRLERSLNYKVIVWIQAIEQTVFYTLSAILLIMGFGLTALTVSVIVRSIIGTTLIYYNTRWVPRFQIDRLHVRSILSFGIPFQSNVFLAFLKDELLNMYLAATLGLTAMGYIGWAKKWAEAPLRIVADNTNRVLFPIFSKVQDDTEKLRKGIEKALEYNSLVLMPMFMGAFFCMPLIVDIIPKYSKWEIAIPSFNLFIFSALCVSFISPLINVFNATGRVKISVSFMILWVVLNWTIVPVLARILGFQGVAVAFAINSLTFVFVIARMKKYVQFSFFNSIRIPFIATIIMGIVLFAIRSVLPFSSIVLLITMILTGGITYLLSLYLITGGKVMSDFVSSLKK